MHSSCFALKSNCNFLLINCVRFLFVRKSYHMKSLKSMFSFANKMFFISYIYCKIQDSRFKCLFLKENLQYKKNVYIYIYTFHPTNIKDTTIYIKRKKTTTNITKLLNIHPPNQDVTSQLSRGPLKVAQKLLTNKRTLFLFID